MSCFLKRAQALHTNSLFFYANLIDHCLSSKNLDFAHLIHAQLIKVGFNSHTFLGNRCVDLYSKVGSIGDALQAFDDISNKNTISWNICLRAFIKNGDINSARSLFDKMVDRDVVTWNSLLSGYASNGFIGYALELFKEMQSGGTRPNEFTFSILASSVRSVDHGKQLHGSMLRSGVDLSNLVVGNSLIDMYGRFGLVDYAFGMFLNMDEVDVITWNTLISGCCKSGCEKLALNQFCLMISAGYSPDVFTLSTVTAVCTNLRDMEKGKQIFAFCMKGGFLSNTVVSSAAIDLFSKCNSLNDSIQIFDEIDIWDSIVCNSMISSYARHGSAEDALQLFVLTLRENLRPNEFTLSSVLSSSSSLLLAEQGRQLHSLVVKLGMESDAVVASSLVEMYAKFGIIDTSREIFANMDVKDLISWNTTILGFAQNGRVAETLELFEKLLKRGPPPDQITLLGVLMACSYGGFVDQGMSIFSSMEKTYGVTPIGEHYFCVIEMLTRAGKHKEAVDIIESMPHEPSPLIWELILRDYGIDGELKLTERVAEKLMEHEPQASLPYLVLARAYEMRGRWESMVWVRKAMKERNAKKVIGCSWIGIRNHIFVFKANHILHYKDRDIYLMLRLLIWEMDIEGCVHDQYKYV